MDCEKSIYPRQGLCTLIRNLMGNFPQTALHLFEDSELHLLQSSPATNSQENKLRMKKAQSRSSVHHFQLEKVSQAATLLPLRH